MAKKKFTLSENVLLKKLEKNLRFKPEDWSKEQVEKYQKHTLINMVPVHDCIMVYKCDMLKKTTAGGIIIPDIVRDNSSQVIGFVLGMAPGMEFGKGMTVSIGDYILYDVNRAKFTAQLEGFEIPMLDAYSVLALLPPSIRESLVILPNPHTAFNTELVDISEATDMEKHVNKTMPTGSESQDQEFQRDDISEEVNEDELKEERGESRKGKKSNIKIVKR